MKVIQGQGMPSQRHHEHGNLFIKLNVKFPEFIDGDKIHHLEAALPPRDPPQTFGNEITVEEVDMSDMDARQQEQAQKSSDAMDEDDDEQPRVQCKCCLRLSFSNCRSCPFAFQVPTNRRFTVFSALWGCLHARHLLSFILFCPRLFHLCHSLELHAYFILNY